MNWTWHVFTIARIPVRLHWTLLFVLAYYFLGPPARGADASVMAFLAALVVMHFAIILVHELGHCWATRRVGGQVDQILLWPLGGMAYVGHSDDPRTDMFVAVSGPATHVFLGGACAALVFLLDVPWHWSFISPIGGVYGTAGLSYGELFLVYALNANASLMAFNLFVPAYPLDGGRILLDFLTLRMGSWRATRVAGTISIVIGVAIIVIAFMTADIFLGLIGVWVLVNAMQLRAVQAPDHEFSPHGYSDRGYRIEEPRKEGYFARRRRQKRERALARRDAEEAELRARVDELLDKVNRGGLESLSPAERRTLEEASNRLRGRG